MKIINGVLSNVGVEDIIDGVFVVPNEVTSIGEYAFSGCNSLINIDIPKGVTSIGKG